MGLCGGDSERKERSKQIERLLQKDLNNSKRELKLLLLGTGESGKSTVIKQMRIIYGKGFKEEKERKEYTILVYRNILRSMRAILDAMELFGIPLQDKSLEDGAYSLLDTDPNTYTDIQPHKELFRRLWPTLECKKCSCENVERIGAPDFVPNVDDVLRAREATTGIHEFVFVLEEAVFRMLDVGGQRSERRKWIHCFENVTSIIFIASCSEYDQALVEQDDMNRMQESVSLFEQIINYHWFREASFILFLNKRDLLEEKIRRTHIRTYFPSFQGADCNVEDAEKFILDLYLSRKPQTHDVYHHFTMATDTKNIEFVFQSVKSTILRIHLKTYNLF